ncbi:sporulation transcriptional regulator SpoIIID [Clostridium sp. WLY-B-L2]|uniref:Sporulation transcriptional regulator SpoIIID n=1 Tax=Clostridium aromativorans TaxID=2836848 RepID=A0ABS8NA36_9CLOT|nr:sporulation transcriptional regulator SpoIIID [Clostridium aromativorans]MCC9296521.1 sporulation transcriptional regulator SpoIIID [Clostridium aromativorans]
MRDCVKDRAVNVGKYLISSKVTVRDAAKVFHVSKSTIFNDCTERLPILDAVLAREVRKVLDFNKNERGIRGGQAVRERYLLLSGL